MASSINASTSSGIVTTADTSGVLQLQANGNTVATLSSSGVNAGIQVASNAAPAFSAYLSSSQTVTSTVLTKVAYDTKVFDTNSNFASSRFTPTVAGYYQVSGRAEVASSVAFMLLYIYKNGSSFKRFTNTNTATVTAVNGSALVYLNGSTDYIELYCNQGGNQQLVNAADSTYFQAAMVRSA